MTDTSMVRAWQRFEPLLREPAHEHGPGIVGDSGERREPHPV